MYRSIFAMAVAVGLTCCSHFRTSNDTNAINELRKRDVITAARAALDYCKGPVKLLVTSIERKDSEIVHLTYRCRLTERPGYSGDMAEQLIHQVVDSSNDIKNDEQRRKNRQEIQIETK